MQMGWHSGNAAQAPKSGKKAHSALAQATWPPLTGGPTEAGSHWEGCFPQSESARLLTRKGRRVTAPGAGHSLAPGRQGWVLTSGFLRSGTSRGREAQRAPTRLAWGSQRGSRVRRWKLPGGGLRAALEPWVPERVCPSGCEASSRHLSSRFQGQAREATSPPSASPSSFLGREAWAALWSLWPGSERSRPRSCPCFHSCSHGAGLSTRAFMSQSLSSALPRSHLLRVRPEHRQDFGSRCPDLAELWGC